MRERSAWFVTCAMGTSVVLSFYVVLGRDSIDAILSFRNQSQTSSAVLGAGSIAADGDAAHNRAAGTREFSVESVPSKSLSTRGDPVPSEPQAGRRTPGSQADRGPGPQGERETPGSHEPSEPQAGRRTPGLQADRGPGPQGEREPPGSHEPSEPQAGRRTPGSQADRGPGPQGERGLQGLLGATLPNGESGPEDSKTGTLGTLQRPGLHTRHANDSTSRIRKSFKPNYARSELVGRNVAAGRRGQVRQQHRLWQRRCSIAYIPNGWTWDRVSNC